MAVSRVMADGRGARAPRRFAHRGRNVAHQWRIGGLEPGPHRGRGLGEQFQIMMPRDRRPQADAGCEVVVALGARHQPAIAALGELRAGIVDGALHHVVVAAQDQHVGHSTAQGFSRRDRHQMRLALAARGFDQRLVVEPFRLRQHRGCDLDQIVERQRADGQRRRGVDRREAACEQRLGGGLDVPHQAMEHVVEQRDLLVRVIHRAVEKKVGDAAQRLDPARDGAVRERGLQFVEQIG